MGGMFSSRFNSAMAFSKGSGVMPEVSMRFLRLLHLALHAALNGATDIELFDLDVEHLGDARQAVDGVENFEQFLLFFDGELQVRAYRISEFTGIGHANGGHHGLVVQG